MDSDTRAQLSARDAVNMMSAKPAWSPKATFDVCRELTFYGAVTAHYNNSKLQHGTCCRGQAGGLSINNCKPHVC